MTRVKKIASILMILISAFSLVACLFIIIQLWRAHDTLTDQLVDGLTLTNEMLETTDQGLILVNITLNNASSSINALAETTLTMGENISNTSSTLNAFSLLFVNDISYTIINTQTALEAAQTSAAVIDGVLTGLASIPLIGLDYNPERSLSVSLGSVAESLDPLSSSIEEIGSDLNTTSTSLETLRTDIEGMATYIYNIGQNLEDSREVVRQYQEQIDQLQSWMEQGILRAPSWVRFFILGVDFLIAWIMVSQVGLLLQGWTLYKSKS